MIRTGQQYRDSIRDGRQVWINSEPVRDVPSHPMFKPAVDIRERIHDMAHEAQHAATMAYRDDAGGTNAVSTELPLTPEDWHVKREDRRKIPAFARDLLNSDYPGHRLTFQLFAQSPPYANLAAAYRNVNIDEPLRVVQKAAGLSNRVRQGER
jgi:4-hydroxyphenylacetate 3-hydroxylase N terminal/4-hydroxyphenylacetate 3-hydroxylase C terminal